jgi:hypothetical protein
VRRIFTLSVAWVAAAIVAAVVAWQGVGLVGDQVTDQHDSGMLTAAQVDAALAGDSDGGGISIPPTSTTLPATGDTNVAGTTDPATTAAGAGAGGTGSGTTPGRSTTTQSRGNAPATGSTTGSGSGGTPSPTPAPAPAAIVRNYSVNGGTASISFSAGEVKVLWATPAAGWSVRTEPEGTGIRVQFESGNARSRIDAWWSGGPQDRVDESTSGGGGSGGGPGAADDSA